MIYFTKRYLIIILIFIGINEGFSQNKLAWREPTEKDLQIAEKNDQCVKANRIPSQERLKNYPFNKGYSVLLISYNDTAKNVNEIPIRRNQLISRIVKEKVLLTETQIDSLTDLFYNVGPTPNDYWFKLGHIGHSCYDPHNGILFINKKSGKVVDYIEICFDCERLELSSKKIQIGEWCEQKFQLIRAYFNSAGLTYTTSRNKENK